MKEEKFYKEKYQQIINILEKLKKKQSISSFFRLVFFLLSIVSFFVLYKYSIPGAILTTLTFFVIFLISVKKHLKLQEQRKYFETYEKVLSAELGTFNNVYSSFNDGSAFEDHRHSYSYDLDIFGKGSLFQMINRTVTKNGEKFLADSFTQNAVKAEQIKSLQEAIMELAQNPEMLLHFRVTGKTSDIHEEETEKLIEWGRATSIVGNKKIYKVIAYLMPALFFLTLILNFIGIADSGLLSLLFIINLGIYSINIKSINKEYQQISKSLKYLKKYQGLISIIEQANYQTPVLTNSIQELKKNKEKAGEILLKLTKVVSAFDNRLNFLVAIFLEGVLFWDFHCLFSLEKWRKLYGRDLSKWIEQVSFFDELISKATFAYNNSSFVYPTTSDKIIVRAKNMGHPFIPSKVRVSNDFEIGRKGDFVIITGANMAGKSTFLRTVGVNLILAKAGMPVCAETFEFKPLKLFTSMRTSDSLAENESYFYAELKRLKEMLDKLKEDDNTFIILDEILKGTNSVDKQKGSLLTLEKIIKLGGTGIIATHDLALTKIEENYPDKIKNKCFEIEIDNARISFDYKLYNGVTQKMNAMLLMEQMNII